MELPELIVSVFQIFFKTFDNFDELARGLALAALRPFGRAGFARRLEHRVDGLVRTDAARTALSIPVARRLPLVALGPVCGAVDAGVLPRLRLKCSRAADSARTLLFRRRVPSRGAGYARRSPLCALPPSRRACLASRLSRLLLEFSGNTITAIAVARRGAPSKTRGARPRSGVVGSRAAPTSVGGRQRPRHFVRVAALVHLDRVRTGLRNGDGHGPAVAARAVRRPQQAQAVAVPPVAVRVLHVQRRGARANFCALRVRAAAARVGRQAPPPPARAAAAPALEPARAVRRRDPRGVPRSRVFVVGLGRDILH